MGKIGRTPSPIILMSQVVMANTSQIKLTMGHSLSSSMGIGRA